MIPQLRCCHRKGRAEEKMKIVSTYVVERKLSVNLRVNGLVVSEIIDNVAMCDDLFL